MMTRRGMLQAVAGTVGGMATGTQQLHAAARHEMPPEWAEHARTFMQWPTSLDVYYKTELAGVQASIARIAGAIARFEEVVILAPKASSSQFASLLGETISTWDVPTEDLWCRDSGPTFVEQGDGTLAVAHIAFNGWGNKQPHGDDGQVAKRVAEELGIPLLPTGLVGEQGGLEHDGAGLVLAHASCWVNPNRNSGTAAVIGQKILDAVGGSKLIWAPGIIGADITDYHIDALARFVAPGKVLIQLPAEIDPHDPWSRAAHETHDILKAATTVDGNPLEIVVVDEPVNIRGKDAQFVASYVNYYVCNGGVVCSGFGDVQADGKAREILQQLYPTREVVMIDTDPIGAAGGGIHCSTQQQPRLRQQP